MSKRHVAVLGGGIIGCTTAYELQRSGHRVTLIERDVLGMGCSFGHASLIQGASVVPIAGPGTLRAVPRMLLDPDQPLVLRWRHLPSLRPYLSRFIAESSPARVLANSRALATIVPRVYEFWKPVIEAVGAEDLVTASGELHVYATERAFEAARSAHNMRRARGVEALVVRDGELRALEPSLGPDITRGVFLPAAHLVADSDALTQRLIKAFVRDGGEVLKETIAGLDAGPDGVTVRLGSEQLQADAAVIALGAFSGSLMRSLGCPVPLNSERGYHLMLPDPGVRPSRTLISGDWRFGISPLSGGVRLAGTAEMTRIGAPSDMRRAERLLPLARRLLPDLDGAGATRWMGHRPSLPDTLPAIGALPGKPHVVAAFGHGHSGFGLAGLTARVVTDHLSGLQPAVDLTPFRPGRFLRGG